MNLSEWNTPPTVPASPIVGDFGAAAPRSDALLPGTRLEEFEIERVLASSGFGIVYLAEDPRAERRVVIKEYLPLTLATRDPDGVQVVLRSASYGEAFERGRRAFIEEALLLARCEHASLVKVLGSWHGNGTVYRAMPHYPGHTLLSLRQRLEAPPDEPSLRALLDGVLGALEVLHAEGTVHGGITPTSILVAPDDHPVLLDGSAARRAIVAEQTRALLTLLEPSFAGPEQTRPSAELPIGPWTDLYGLAAVMHYCVSGMLPGMASEGVQPQHEPLAAVVQRLRVRLPSLHVSRQFAAAIDAALAPSPDDRPQSVAEFRTLLDGEAPTELIADTPAYADDDGEPVLHEAGIAEAAREASNDPAIGPTEPGRVADEQGLPTPLWRPRPYEARTWPRWVLAAGLLVAVGAAAWTMLPSSPGPEVLASRARALLPPAIAPTDAPLPGPPVAAATPPAPVAVATPPAPVAAATPTAPSPAAAVTPTPAATAAAPPALPEAPTAAIAPRVTAPVAKASTRDEALRKSAQAKPGKHAPARQLAAATPAAPKPTAVPTAASPREACGGRTQFSLYRCMQTQCAQAAWQQHAQCKRLRLKDEVE